MKTYVAPHVCGIHAKLPAIKVEIRVKRVMYTRSSVAKGRNFHKSATIGFGEARCEWGLVARSSRTGSRMMMDDNDRWTSMDSASSDCDTRSI